MKKIWIIIVLLLSSLQAEEVSPSSYPILHMREEQVTPAFFDELVKTFQIKVVLDMRTGEGNLPTIASYSVPEVHTIESDDALYEQAKRHFYKKNQVHCHKGTPEQILPKIASQLEKKKTLICIEINHKEGMNIENVLASLKAIKNSPIEDPVFLIGGISKLDTSLVEGDAPHLEQVRNAIRTIAPHDEFWVLGPIAIAYSPREKVTVSPIVQACSLSQLASITALPLEKFLAIEKALINTPLEEKRVLDFLQSSYTKHKTHPSTHHYLVWKGLSLMGEKEYFQASRYFHKALASGYDHPRVYWYIAQAEYERRNFLEARRVLKLLLKLDPDFTPAKEMLIKVS